MFPTILNKCFIQDSCASGFYYTLAKDIRWCQKSSFGGWNLLLTRNNLNNNFIDFVSDKCAKKLVCNVGEEATMFCVSHHLVIFPEWKLRPINLAIYGVMKYSKVISKECLQTLSHDNVLEVTRFSLYNWIQINHLQKVARLYHLTIFSKFLHWDFMFVVP